MPAHRGRVRTAITAILVVIGLALPGLSLADSYDTQIKALQQQADGYQAQAKALHAQANSYQARVNQLNAQIGSLQAEISLNQAKYDHIVAQITQAQVEMARQKDILAAAIKSMYLASGVTPVEMLASSGDISQYFNQQQYQDKVKNKIQDAIAAIETLKAQLEQQQTDLKHVLATQQAQKQQLAASQAEVSSLLAAAQQSAAAADAQVQARNAQVSGLRAQQAAVLAARFGGSRNFSSGGACGGGYPAKWCSTGQDTLIDNWGMFNRECVSYAAFRVAASGRYMPYWGGVGNAKQWPGNARAAGIAVDDNPRTGDIAISLAGPYGHAMYVESVSGGSIHVSQYNYGNRGEYSEMTIPIAGLSFIHF